MRSVCLVVAGLLIGSALIGKLAAADEPPASLASPAPLVAVGEPVLQPLPPPQPPPAEPVTLPSEPPRRHLALRNTGITMTVLGGVQLVAGGVLYGLAVANCKRDADCGGIPHELAPVFAGFVMGIGAGAVMIPGIIMWGVGTRF